jgi:hypothetical protein
MLKLYKFYWDCGRMGYLDGMFIEDDAEVARFIGKQVNFGEALGKHSEIYGTFDEGDLEVITDDQDFIDKCVRFIGYTTLSGHNPISRMRDHEADGEYGEEDY